MHRRQKQARSQAQTRKKKHARWIYAGALYRDPGATLDDLRESVATFEEIERIARRMLGGAHPTTVSIEKALQQARKVLRARESGRKVIFDS